MLIPTVWLKTKSVLCSEYSWSRGWRATSSRIQSNPELDPFQFLWDTSQSVHKALWDGRRGNTDQWRKQMLADMSETTWTHDAHERSFAASGTRFSPTVANNHVPICRHELWLLLDNIQLVLTDTAARPNSSTTKPEPEPLQRWYAAFKRSNKSINHSFHRLHVVLCKRRLCIWRPS